MLQREYVAIGTYEDLKKYVEIDFNFESASVDVTKEECPIIAGDQRHCLGENAR